MKRTIWLLLCGVMICFVAACEQKATLDNKNGDTMNTVEEAGKLGIVKLYRQSLPAMRFIGKKYGGEDGETMDAGVADEYKKWYANNWFALIEGQIDREAGKIFLGTYEESGSEIGMMRKEPHEYWIGKFTPAGTPVPKGFRHMDFPESVVGVCWLRAKMSNMFHREWECAKALTDAGHEIATNEKGEVWYFERYFPPRFDPDANGVRVLDLCFYVK